MIRGESRENISRSTEIYLRRLYKEGQSLKEGVLGTAILFYKHGDYFSALIEMTLESREKPRMLWRVAVGKMTR